jgi:DNA uptake protein ComE-like DNA-binding protein
VPERREAANWVWISLLPLGLGAWAPIYAGVHAKKAVWIALGLLWSIVTAVGWVEAASTPANDASGGGWIILGWIGAIATSFAVRDAYRKALASPLAAALDEAEQIEEEREQGRKIARETPEVARQLGIGRPDRPGAKDAHLVDVNNVPPATLESLPGVDAPLAKRIADCRSETGFTSVEDLGAALDLDSKLVEALRDRAVFLPRSV